MVDDFCWNDKTDMLCVMSDQRLINYIYPNVVFVDQTLINLT